MASEGEEANWFDSGSLYCMLDAPKANFIRQQRLVWAAGTGKTYHRLTRIRFLADWKRQQRVSWNIANLATDDVLLYSEYTVACLLLVERLRCF